jgi:hypothetical protein
MEDPELKLEAIMVQGALNFEKPRPPILDHKFGTQKDKIYQWLRVYGNGSNGDFVKLGIFRYGQRLKEIRADLEGTGWKIRTDMLDGGKCLYHLEKI